MSVEVTQVLTRITRGGPSNAADTAVDTGDTVVFTLVTDFPIYAPGASLYGGFYNTQEPKLTLGNGAVATYSGVDSQGRLEFSYKVGSNQDVADLAVTGFASNGFIPLPKNVYFEESRLIGTSGRGLSAAIGDANGDGRPDFAVNQSTGGPILYLNDGNGNFSAASTPVPPFATTPFQTSVVADIDNDGISDTVSYRNTTYQLPGAKYQSLSSVVEIKRGLGDGTFEDTRIFASDLNLNGIAVADVDGDGKLDVVTSGAEYLGAGQYQPYQLSYLLNASIAGQTQFDRTSVATATGARTGIRVDTTAPVVGSVVAGGPGIVNGTGTLVTGQTATIFLNMSESVTVTNAGQLVLTLKDGGQATFDAAASTATQLVFRHTVAVDQGTSDLAVTGIALNGAVIRDVAGNDAVLSGAVTNPPGTLRIDGFIGTSGDDVFRGRGGAETFRGLGGNDTYYVDSPQDVVLEAQGQGFDTVIASVNYSLRAGQEIEVLQAAANVFGLTLVGNAFAQTIVGTIGRDTLNGGGGADVMQGKEGDDIYSVDDRADQVIEATGGGNDRVFSTTTYKLAAGQEIETLQLLAATGAAKLDLTGNEFGQTLVGNAGANLLDGGAGADMLIGNKGDDTYLVDQAADQVIEAAGGGNDRVFSTVSYSLGTGQEVEALQLLAATGRANLNLTGNEYGQTLVGNAGANILDGRGGADTMIGNGGNDTYIVDNARDVVRETTGGGYDTILSSVTYSLGAGVQVEALRFRDATSQLDNDLTGNEFGQALGGNAGANVLDGRGGADVLTGGRGQDAFVFSTTLGTGNVDRITDFTPVDDTIRLSETVFSAIAPGPLAESAFKDISSGKVDVDDRILYRQATGELFYDADGSGKGVAVKFAVLDNQAKLTHDDFFVV